LEQSVAIIHQTVGVYKNGDMKRNGVPAENLEAHIKYNLFWRPGRAFFVDGVCHNKGYLNDQEIAAAQEKIKTFPAPTRDTQPYV
jgi:hypothetical protein